MKISNPHRYTGFSANGAEYEKLSRLLTEGDVICMYSQDKENWHCEKTSEDEWVKYSFDGGKSWILEFKYQNKMIFGSMLTPTEDTDFDANDPASYQKGAIYEFSCADYTSEQWMAVKASNPLLFVNGADDWTTTVTSFRFKFIDSTQTIKLALLEDLPSDTTGIYLKMMLTSGDSVILGGANATPFMSAYTTPENTSGTGTTTNP